MKLLNFLLVFALLFSLACSNDHPSLGITNAEPDVFYEVDGTDGSSVPAVEEPGISKAFQADMEDVKQSPNGNKEDLFQEPKADGPLRKDQKIIKEAEIKIRVEDFMKSVDEIKTFTKKYDAYISKENEHQYSYSLESNMVIRVLNKDFESLLDQVIELADQVEVKNINAKDVTEEYIDLKSRIRTKKEVEKRYYEILTKAKTIEDILKVEGKLRVVREEIEAKEGRLNYLRNKVGYSTINLEVYQKLDPKYEPEKGPNFFNRIAKAFNVGWKGLVNFLIGLVYVWPILLLVACILYVSRRILKKRKTNVQSK